MPDRKAIQRGLDFETRVAKILDGKTQPGSGNKFYAQSDVVAHGLQISCKSNQCYTFPEIMRRFYEAIDYSHGTGNIPALAIEDTSDGEGYIFMKMSDFAKALEDITIPQSVENKSAAKRKEADIPIMLR